MVVEDDGYGVSHIVAGQRCPLLGTLVVHLHVYGVALHGIMFGGCGGHYVALHRCLPFEGDELPVGSGLVFAIGFLDHIAVGVGDGDFNRFHFPYCGEVGGHSALGQRCVEDAVHHSAVVGLHHTDYGASGTGAAEQAHEVGSLLGAVLLHESLGQPVKVAGHFLIIINFEELEVCRRFEKFRYTFRFLYAREFEQDLALLVLEFLDVRGYYTELVDTCAEDVEGGVHLRGNLLVEGSDYLIVGGIGFEFSEELAFTGKEACHGAGLEILGNFGDEALFRPFHPLRFGLAYGIVDFGQLLFARGVLTENVGHRDFEHHVHTSLEVQTHAYLHLAYLVVGVPEIDFLFVDRIVELFQTLFVGVIGDVRGFGSCGSELFRLFLVMRGHERERNVEAANQNQEHRDDADKPFVLHFLLLLFVV